MSKRPITLILAIGCLMTPGLHAEPQDQQPDNAAFAALAHALGEHREWLANTTEPIPGELEAIIRYILGQVDGGLCLYGGSAHFQSVDEYAQYVHDLVNAGSSLRSTTIPAFARNVDARGGLDFAMLTIQPSLSNSQCGSDESGPSVVLIIDDSGAIRPGEVDAKAWANWIAPEVV